MYIFLVFNWVSLCLHRLWSYVSCLFNLQLLVLIEDMPQKVLALLKLFSIRSPCLTCAFCGPHGRSPPECSVLNETMPSVEYSAQFKAHNPSTYSTFFCKSRPLIKVKHNLDPSLTVWLNLVSHPHTTILGLSNTYSLTWWMMQTPTNCLVMVTGRTKLKDYYAKCDRSLWALCIDLRIFQRPHFLFFCVYNKLYGGCQIGIKLGFSMKELDQENVFF